MRQTHADGYLDFAANRAGHLFRSACLLTSGDTHLAEDLVQETLGRLAPKDRAVLVLRYWEDRSIEETADAMRASSSSVRTRSVRALARLRELLGGSLAEFAAN
ncbi:sigma factor-like helix-turn-helix DNA-binding protein [Streptomyces fildesensis]|uniref:Sigma factor-like helix-turn-helix DNA-binding protein n=1 Tax=Streptomyces fildesensis TaxID=375757 RepID=A0ABW8CEF7_9ACTN